MAASDWAKTHLLQAIGHYVAINSPELSVKYMTVESLHQ